MSRTMADVLHSYILPGRAADARVGIAQAQAGERLGLNGIFLSERWDTKELGAVMGALSQATQRVHLTAGMTHFGTRHPLVQAGMAATLQTLSGGRFVLGFGRAMPALLRKLGIPVLTNAGMADYVDILRRLWAAETVSYRGPAGDYPQMQLAQACAQPPPIVLGAIGPKTLALGGAHFDGVVLHPFLTTAGVARSVRIVREAATHAGRDPRAVTIYATIVTAPDTLSDEQRADILAARAVSYFMHREIGSQLVAINDWDLEPMLRVAESGLNRLEFGRSEVGESRRLMAQAVSLLPPAWLCSGAALGSVAQCVARLREYLDTGIDQILLHGTTPDQQGDLVAAMRAQPLSI